MLTLDWFMFDIVNGCQLKCIGCPNKLKKYKVEIATLDTIRLCLGNLDVDKVNNVRLFNYGEPLLHPHLPEIVKEFAKQPWYVPNSIEVSTNGQHTKLDKVEEMLATGLVGTMVISCDGEGTQEDYERLRPPAKWDVLLNFLETVQKIKQKYNLSTSLISRSITLTPEGRSKWTDILATRGWEAGFRGWIPLPEASLSAGVTGDCHFIKDAMDHVRFVVDANGIVVPCCAHPIAYRLGDLKQETYTQILAGPLYKEFADKMLHCRSSLPICSLCNITKL